jgi:hypothetical protein
MGKLVMPGLVPGIHVLAALKQEGVDGRDKPGHDEKENRFQLGRKNLKMLDAFSVLLAFGVPNDRGLRQGS